MQEISTQDVTHHVEGRGVSDLAGLQGRRRSGAMLVCVRGGVRVCLRRSLFSKVALVGIVEGAPTSREIAQKFPWSQNSLQAQFLRWIFLSVPGRCHRRRGRATALQTISQPPQPARALVWGASHKLATCPGVVLCSPHFNHACEPKSLHVYRGPGGHTFRDRKGCETNNMQSSTGLSKFGRDGVYSSPTNNS